MLTQEDDVRLWRDSTYLTSSLDSANSWKADIQQNQIGLKLPSFAYRLFTSGSLTNYIQGRLVR